MKWIISNHKTAFEDKNIENYAEKLNEIQLENINMIICPKDNHLQYFNGKNYVLGCQDINMPLDKIKEYNVKYCIVGHSDQRHKYNETNQQINSKIIKLLNNNITPILCIGEELNSNTKLILKQQLEEGLNGINKNIIIAYEPVWAIGSGNIPNIYNLREIINFIDEEVTNLLGYKPLILYGGSVNEETIKELEKVEELDGYLIGSASLKIEQLEKLIEVVK